MTWRESPQPLLPLRKPEPPAGQPDIYPGHPLVSGAIQVGYAALARAIAGHSLVLIDGYIGIFWEELRASLEAAGLKARWLATADFLKPEAELEAMLAPFLGGDDPLFGKRFTGDLSDFFMLPPTPPHSPLPEASGRDSDASEYPNAIGQEVSPHRYGGRFRGGLDFPPASTTIIYGIGAFLFADGYRVYIDLPKNEIQYRSRAGCLRNIGARSADDPKAQYKRMYFVDWPALNRHKALHVRQIDLFADGQDPALPRFIAGVDARAAFDRLVHTAFRVRPWFEPGAWGGQWLKSHIPGLAQDAPNYAWSFEMIAPEQGIILEDDGALLELSYDWLQYHDNRAVLGDYAANFGYEFPIRFDFLDTVGGGNLSLQCHPRPDFIREQFGEHFTQDETYYIFAAEPAAFVHLGFQPGIDPADFRTALEASQGEGSPVAVERYVQRHPAQVGDLFLIPHGAPHCSGAGSVVLEISATPYIFTFKMYDWLRLGLDGSPRPINLERAFANLDFSLAGDAVQALLSQPVLVHEDAACRIERLPTHAKHFYDIQRLTLRGSIDLRTDGSPQVLMATAGSGITLEAAGLDAPLRFHVAETFIVPAACGAFRLSALGSEPAAVIRAYLRPAWFQREENQWLTLD